MLVIIQNGKITGIEKKLLNILNTDLSSLSETIDTIALQISSIKNSEINIAGNTFSVKNIDITSTEDIKIYTLELISEELVPEQSSSEPENEFEPKIIEQPHFESKLEIEKEKEPISFEKSEDFLVIPQEEQKEKTLDIGLINIPEEEPAKEEKEKEEKLITLEEEKIEFENQQEEKENETPMPVSEEGMIEISFEDDLEEIRNILKMNKDEFNNAVSNELKKASEELGLDYNELLKWHDQLIEQIKDEKKDIYKYINNKDYVNLHESYHKLKGAALNLRLSQIALVLKKLDELSKAHEDIEKIKTITEDFYKLIENETAKLSETHTKTQPAEQNSHNLNSKPDKYVENVILKTIQTYLKTQNEAQFQKDKKYIEKLLNKKINSIEDLEKIVKGM